MHILKIILDKTIRKYQYEDDYESEYFSFDHHVNYLWLEYYDQESSDYWLEKASKSDVLTCIVHNRQVPGKVLI